jgi:hypothetical protein
MDSAQLVAQWIIGLGILNVWILRPQIATAYRSGHARNMKEEFAAYGLPVWFMYAIGAVKVGLALALILGTWQPAIVRPAAFAMAALMTGAVVMHIKVKDTLTKTLPSFIMLGLSAFVAMV